MKAANYVRPNRDFVDVDSRDARNKEFGDESRHRWLWQKWALSDLSPDYLPESRKARVIVGVRLNGRYGGLRL